MFSRMPRASLPVDFPPISTAALVLTGAVILPHAPDLQGAEEWTLSRKFKLETPIQVTITPMPSLEIQIFVGDKPRWWIRRCKSFFHYYHVAENQKVNLVAAYLNV